MYTDGLAEIAVEDNLPHAAASLLSWQVAERFGATRRLLARLEEEGPQPVYDRLVLELGDPRG